MVPVRLFPHTKRMSALPQEPVDSGVLLTPEDFGIPHRRCFTPSELAPYFVVSSRTIVRLIEEGSMRAVPVGRDYKIPWIEIANWLMRQQGALN